MAKKKRHSGAEAFIQYYSSIFGERWEALFSALKEESLPKAYALGLEKPYFLDEASVLCAQALEVCPGDRVLDLCAAPGGKSLVLASLLKEEGELRLNEKSPERFFRLKRNMEEHFSPGPGLKICYSMKNGSAYGLEKECWDRILLDAPCSSERHIVHSPKHMKSWTPGRSKTLSVSQFSLLAGAWDALVTGGTLIYSTCALGEQENDQVIGRLMKKRERVLPQELIFPQGEKTRFGWHFLPDTTGGWGPLYLAKLKKGEC